MKKYIAISLIGILIMSGLCAGSYNINHLNEIERVFMKTNYEMVIIAPNSFSNALQPLIQHKNDHDVSCFLQTTETIYSEYNGRDDAESIKLFIKDAIETYDIKYVLLIGGRIRQSFRWYVPVRYANVDDGFMHKKILSDLYFADIYKENSEFEDWDSDGDGIFAEWNGFMAEDKIDLIPDISLGRLHCRNTQEVVDIAQKIIYYENNAYQQSQFHNILLIGGDTNPGVGHPFPYEGEADCEWIIQYLNGFSPQRLYISDGSLTGSDDFISAFNKGFGFVAYHGHGLIEELKTFKLNSQEEVQVFHNDYIQDLENTMFPVMVVGCCLTTNFDVGVFDFFKIFENMEKYHVFIHSIDSSLSECIGWNMVKKLDGGSIAHIGSSSTAWGEVGDKNNDSIPDSVQTGYTSGLCSEFFRIYGEDEINILGDVFNGAVRNVVIDNSGRNDKIQCKCILEFQLLGDPSLKIGGYP